MKNNSIKNLFIAGLTLLSFGFLSAQFVIPSGINNALQVIQRVLVTTTGTFTGAVVMDTNTGANKIYINPSFLSMTGAYSGQYVLTLNASGYISFTTGASTISGATISGGSLILAMNNGTTVNVGPVVGAQGPAGPQWPAGAQWTQGTQWTPGVGITNIASNATGTFTIYLSNWSDYTFNIPSGWVGGTGSQTLSLLGNTISISNGNSIDLWSLWFWSLLWNAWTNPTINFLGTTDNQDLVFRTNNQERMRILWASGYVGIGTASPVYPLTISGGIYTYENEVWFFVGNDASNITNWYPLPGIFMTIDATAASWSSVWLALYDTRDFWWDSGLWLNISTMTGAGINWVESEASLNTSDGEKMDLRVEQWFDFSNYNQGNGNWIVTTNNAAWIDMSADIINIKVSTGIVRTVSGWSLVSTNALNNANIDINPFSINMYGSWGLWNMYFNSIIWMFGFGTNTPGNMVDIGVWLSGTLWLRFSARAGNSGQILWLNNNGDVVLLWNIAWFGGGGWSPTPNYVKLGELDYTQLNSHTGVTVLIPLNIANQLPANSLVTRVFMEIEPFFWAGWYRVDDFFLIASGTDIGSFNPSDWIIYGPGIQSPFWWYSTYVFSFVPAAIANPINDDYSIYVRYSDNAVHNDWMAWNVSFVVEYETMPAISF